MSTKNRLKIHFIGIGGIGVSALAKYYLKKGYKVSGSDLVSSEITQALKKLGAKIKIGSHQQKNITKDTNLVIYSPAVQSSNPELKEAKKRRITIQSYPEALGELTKQHFTIAVSGTHGKSTTTCMIGLLLVKAGLDPTVIVGTKMKEFGDSNCRAGKSKYLVIEADEHMASFLNYWPKIIVLTTIEADHLDYYKSLKNILKTFRKYIGHLPKEGTLVANKDDKNIKRIMNYELGIKNKKYYSVRQLETKKLKKILKVPGVYNICNALAALIVARILNVPDKISFKVLSGYKGCWRRFDIIKTKSFILISDYGHHPTEIKVTLKAAREKYLNKKIWCVFQPHQYQRTYYLFKDFVKALKEAPVDKLILTDIYDVAGREEKKIKEKINSKKTVELINKDNVIYLPKEKILNYLKKKIKRGDVVIIMGAGDIYNLVSPLTHIGNKLKIN
jgi:UDP-N-acetylmuramate--alanine ligase